MSRNTILKQVLDNVACNSEKIILSDSNGTYSWKEIVRVTSKIAEEIKLIENRRIAIEIDRTIYTPCAYLACMFVGKIFVPVNDKQPDARKKGIMEAIKANKLLSKDNGVLEVKAQEVTDNSNYKQYIKQLEYLLSDEEEGKKENIVYTLYTSGSTGDPKGVNVTYENILNTLNWSKMYMKWDIKDTIGIATNFSFDISLFDYFSCIYFNIKSHIIEDTKDPFRTVEEIIENNITSLFSSPSLYTGLSKYKLLGKVMNSQLKQIISGGDFFPPIYMRDWMNHMPKLNIWNVWGPTETSIVNTMHKVSNLDIEKAMVENKAISIGRMDNELMKCIVVNQQDRNILVEANTIGEIAVIGKSVSLGYLGLSNHQDYKRKDGEKIFFTNDLGYYDLEKKMYIVGRRGSIVKINGFRVDLKEIEYHIYSLNLTSDVVVMTSTEDKNRIIAVIERKDNQQKLTEADIRKYLRTRVPNYMIPKKFYIIDNIPKNKNGKLDRVLLKKLYR